MSGPPIPPANKNDGDPGHDDDHNAISIALQDAQDRVTDLETHHHDTVYAADADLENHITDLVSAHAASSISVDTTGFDGVLAPTDDTLQKVAQKVDDLVIPTVPVPLIRLYYANQVGTTPTTWTNMPAALSTLFANGATQSRGAAQQINLTGYTQARFLVSRAGGTGAASAVLFVRYKTGAYSSVPGDYVQLGTTDISLAVGSLNTMYQTGWVSLVPGATGECWVSVLGSGGNGTDDPQFPLIYVDFR